VPYTLIKFKGTGGFAKSFLLYSEMGGRRGKVPTNSREEEMPKSARNQ
jgi:hypothetical protein